MDYSAMDLRSMDRRALYASDAALALFTRIALVCTHFGRSELSLADLEALTERDAHSLVEELVRLGLVVELRRAGEVMVAPFAALPSRRHLRAVPRDSSDGGTP